MNNQCVFVIGMHRSGTSLCSAALHALGFELGDIGDYADESNPKGFFENFEIVKFNDELLSYLGSSWISPGLINATIQLEDDGLKPFIDRALGIMKVFYEPASAFVIKDPRMSLLIPFWELVLKTYSPEILIKYVVMVRNPLEVCLSHHLRLKQKSSYLKLGSSSNLMYLLWLQYYRYIAQQFSPDTFLLIDFADMLGAPQNTLEKLAAFSDADNNQEAVQSFVKNFISDNLYRSQAPDPNTEHVTHMERQIFDCYLKIKSAIHDGTVDHTFLFNTLTSVMKNVNALEVIDAVIEPTAFATTCLIQQEIQSTEYVSALQKENKKYSELLADERALHRKALAGLEFAEKLLNQERLDHAKTVESFAKTNELLAAESHRRAEAVHALAEEVKNHAETQKALTDALTQPV